MSDDLRKALEDCRRELWHCAQQLAAHGRPGAPGDSVDRAIASADTALASTPPSSPDLSGRSDDDLHTMRNRIDKEFARRGIVTGKDGPPPLITSASPTSEAEPSSGKAQHPHHEGDRS